MTEQEKREKAIDEISKLICCHDLQVVSCDGECHLHYTCLSAAIGMAIANEGYRKEEEVQKETARKILLRIKVFLDEQTETVKRLSRIKSSAAIPQSCVECYEGSQDNRIDELSRIAKEFGVEVEE